ncbi:MULTISPECIES: PepSY domain-containing protein [Marinobacter]|uniref:PepSY domain-containing protein n=1 Tax=Marinobacter shengliensis TaxID=1389223 RepID=A0ABV4WA98_9GAMM|nr:PepSY domain-containing protein [Marinobacter nauticus]
MKTQPVFIVVLANPYTRAIGVVLWLVSCLCLFAALPVLADDDVSWRQLHQDVQRGSVRPLSEILDILAEDWIGEVIDVEIEREDGRLIYEIELLGPQGQRVEFEVDAATGEVLEIEGRNLRGMERR